MRRVKALLALTVLLGLLVGVPAALAGTIGNPGAALPDLQAGDLSDTVLVALLASVAWVAWAQFAFATVVELVSAVRRSPMPRPIPGVLTGQQQLARSLVTAVFLLGPVTATAALSGAIAPHPLTDLPRQPLAVSASTTLTAVHSAALNTPAAPAGASAAGARGTGRGGPATTVYTIPAAGAGPATLWDIAETQLGAGERWQEIWQLNQGRVQPGGEPMTSPRRLLPGWTVLVPAPANPAGAGSGASATAPAGPAPAAGAATTEVTVQAGDTLSELSVGHGQDDWRRTWQVNAGRAEPGGARYTDPDLIRPGWRLSIPAAAGPSGATPTAASPAAASPVGQPPHPTPTARVPAAPAVPAAAAVPAAPAAPAVPAVPAVPSTTAAGPSGAARTATGGADQPTAARGVDGPAVAPAPAPAGHGGLLSQPAVQVVGFAGGGVLLAASTLEALRRLRRRQFRDRTPGRTIGSTPAGLAPMEKALLTRGAAGAGDVDWLNATLAGLAQTIAADSDGVLPDVVAVRLAELELELVLTAARHDPPAPWRADQTGLRWTLARGDAMPTDAGAARRQSAPYPTLATVGYTAAGEHWLLDLERVGALSLVGDATRCLNLARFLAAELAHNSWSDQLLVTLVGFGSELAGLNPSRVQHRSSLAQAARDAHASLRETAQVLQASGTDVLEGRLRDGVVGDGWSPHVLLVAPDGAPGEAAEVEPDLDRPALLGLLDTMRAQRSRTAVAVVLAGDTGHEQSTRWQLHIDEQGLLSIPALEVQLIAQQLPRAEAADLAALLQLAADGPDTAVPPAAGDQPWEAFADEAGAPLPQFTGGTHTGGALVGAACTAGGAAPAAGAGRGSDETCVLPLAPAAYLPLTATTTQDVAALAPPVSPEVRQQVEDADPSLEEDLRLWHDPASGIAKLTLLGPVAISDPAGGQANDKRRDRVTEVVAYLACRPQGVTTEQWVEQMCPDQTAATGRPRTYANTARQWLGKDPRTGQDYLPRANEGSGKVGVYQLRGVLVDAELFRRLRLRGVARGAGGLADLQAALDLVSGEPLSRLRAAGGQWLVDTPVNHHYTAMIVDVAHLVATHHLAAGTPDLAAAAAQVSLLAGSHDDIALLDLVAASDAAGHQAEAEAYVARILANHDADVEEDLPPRTYDVLRRRRWLPQQDARAS